MSTNHLLGNRVVPEPIRPEYLLKGLVLAEAELPLKYGIQLKEDPSQLKQAAAELRVVEPTDNRVASIASGNYYEKLHDGHRALGYKETSDVEWAFNVAATVLEEFADGRSVDPDDIEFTRDVLQKMHEFWQRKAFNPDELL